jgi:hypothetical protein
MHRNWLVEVRQEPPEFNGKARRNPKTHPLSWPVVTIKLCWTRFGAVNWSHHHSGLGFHTRITHLGKIS